MCNLSAANRFSPLVSSLLLPIGCWTIVVIFAASQADAVTYRQIMLTGNLGPVIDGQVTYYDGIDNEYRPVINNQGSVAFLATLEDSVGRGVGRVLMGPRPEDGQLHVVANSSQEIPGLEEGTLLGGFRYFRLNDANQMAFHGLLSTSQEAIIGPDPNDPSSFSVLAREGESPLGVDDGAEIWKFDPIVFNDQGQVAFRAQFRWEIDDGIFVDNDFAVIGPNNNDELAVLAREGEKPPGIEVEGAIVSNGSGDTPLTLPILNSNGQTAFVARVRYPTNPISVSQVQYGPLDANDLNFQPALFSGTPFPGTNDGTLIGNFARPFSDSPAINDQGHMAVLTSVKEGDVSSLVVVAPLSDGSLAVVAKEGEVPLGIDPNSGYHYTGFGTLAMNGNSDVAFSAGLWDGVNEYYEAIVAPINGTGSELAVILAENAAAPGQSDGSIIGGLGWPVMNKHGDLVVTGSILDAEGNFDSHAVFTYTNGEAQTLLRTGNTLETTLDDGSVIERTLAGISMKSGVTGGQDGRGSPLNDNGELVLRLTFQNENGGFPLQTSGVFVFNIDPLASNRLPGDFNGDGIVDLADYSVWRNNLGAADTVLPPGTTTDDSGLVDADDYLIWKANFGSTSPSPSQSVPEPTHLGLLLVGIVGLRLRIQSTLQK